MICYQEWYEKYYFPIFESIFKGRKTATHYFQSLKSQWVSHGDVLCNQSTSLDILFKHAEQWCPYYKNMFKGLGFDVSSCSNLSNISKLPILTKEIIKKNYKDIVSAKHADAIWTKSTGGSTGQPLGFAYTKESYEWRVAMSKRGYAWAGALPGARQAYIWGVQLGEVNRLKKLKEKLHHYIDNQLYFNCFYFDEKAMVKCLAEINLFKPVSIIGYTNPLYNFALFVGDNSKVHFTPQSIICAAEKVHPHQREVIERVFGAKVFNTYGSREFMLIAAECEQHDGLHVSAENLIVEVVKEDGTPAEDGETGKVVVTDLHNYGMPFIRYEIGDLATATTRTCQCGRGLPLIADVVGRTLDVIRTADGKIIPGEFFPHLMKDFLDIARFQVVQEALDYLVIKIVPAADLSVKTKEQIEIEVKKIVGHSMVVKFEVVPEIPLTATGKFRVTISKITGKFND